MPDAVHNAREFLRERLNDLLALSADIECGPFRSGGSPTQLIVAVDWSEVYAYAVADAPPAHDRFVQLMRDDEGREISRTGHQVALLVLFERLPALGVPILLLPPYARELEHYVRLAHARVLTDRIPAVFGEIDHRLRHDAELRPAIDELVRFTATLATLPAAERYDRFCAKIDESRAKELIGRAFGDLLRSALLADRRPLLALQSLLDARSDRPAPVRPLPAIVGHRVTEGLRADLLGHRVGHWDRVFSGTMHKANIARFRDAQALALIEQLIPSLHAARHQLLFTTRDAELLSEIEHCPGRFAYLTRRSDGDPISRLTVARSWRVFLELGLVLEGREFDEARRLLAERIADTRSRLAELDPARPRRSQRDTVKRLRAVLGENIQNVKAVLATVDPRLQTQTDSRQHAIQLFVKYVTDPKGFREARRRLRQEHLDLIHNRQFDALLAHFFGGATARDRDQLYFGGCSPLVPKLLDGLDVSAASAISEPVRAGFTMIAGEIIANDKTFGCRRRRVDWRASLEQLRRQASTAAPVAGATVAEGTVAGDAAALLMLAAQSRELFENVAYFSVRYREALDHASVPGLVIECVCRADRELALGNHAAAALELRDGYEHVRKRLSQRSSGTWWPAFVNSGLLLHLDLADQKGERVHDFIRALDDPRRFALEEWLERLVLIMDDDPPMTSRLRARISNNIVYAAARLAPIYDAAEWAVPNYYLSDLRFRKVEDGRVLRLERWALEDKRVARHLESLESIPRNRLPASFMDTIAYAKIKVGLWKEPPSRALLWHEAERLLTRLIGRRRLMSKAAAAARGHLDLLGRLRSMNQEGSAA